MRRPYGSVKATITVSIEPSAPARTSAARVSIPSGFAIAADSIGPAAARPPVESRTRRDADGQDVHSAGKDVPAPRVREHHGSRPRVRRPPPLVPQPPHPGLEPRLREL